MLFDVPNRELAAKRKDSDLDEWILVEHPEIDAPAKRVTRKHYDLNLKAKGFKIHGEEVEKPAKRGKTETKDVDS